LDSFARSFGVGTANHSFIEQSGNFSIEAVVDRTGFEKHELSVWAKDIGSAPVFLSLLLLGVVWSIIPLIAFGYSNGKNC
jgi:diacylglycerol kinase